ncbi:MAG: hypothetical protein JW744_02615 [Candidatus Diapherotrites archaeon]|uniref:Uncharacterized protein n=1 Tax=Candidatus Iainarchaeum sp. TaxID=3101447 RepID=A0A938YWX2_9ARCH|nr:hypothetical protein [Candidatus Diapherotrites archaeon]
MDKRILLAGLLLAIVLLSGCVKVEMRENIGPDGMSDITVKMDMSALASMPGAEDMDNPCEGMSSNDSMIDTTCTFEDNVVTITGKLDRSNLPGLVMGDGGIYKFNVKDALKGLDTDSATAGTGTGDPTEMTEEQRQQMKTFGVTYDYYVKLPGTITAQEGGVIQSDGFVKFDMLALPEKAFVESSTAGGFAFDSNMLLIGGIVVAVVALVLAVLLLKRKK